MKILAETVFGYTPKQWFAGLVLGSAVMCAVGMLAGLIVIVVIAAAIQYRNYRAKRPEAAWEISEKGTRELWNDGPKLLACPTIEPRYAVLRSKKPSVRE